jgi:chaperonin cofactor prefoldin
MREEYVRNLEEERETLEARLRRLEREIEELRRASPKP